MGREYRVEVFLAKRVRGFASKNQGAEAVYRRPSASVKRQLQKCSKIATNDRGWAGRIGNNLSNYRTRASRETHRPGEPRAVNRKLIDLSLFSALQISLLQLHPAGPARVDLAR
jgi:hypothetical protein